MTREEAIKRLKEARNTIQPFRYVDEAIDYAVKALEQEPCTDAISRQAVLDLATTIETDDYSGNEIVDVVEVEDIKQLPPVTPTKRVGHWEWDRGLWCRRCSECHLSRDSKYSNYCPNCGAKMQEVEECQ